MSKLLLGICLFCALSVCLADLTKVDDANKTTANNDKKMIILDAKPVLKSPNARDLKQSESHIGILYPHHPHFHHHGHGYHHHGHHHHGYHHYPYHHKYHHLHHYPYYHHYPYLHHHYHSHFHKYPYYHGHYPHHHHYPYYGYIHFFNIYGLNFSPFSLLNYPLYHLNHLKRPIHSPHHSLPYLHHNNHCPCECSKPHGYGIMKPPTHSYVGHHHISKSKHHDQPIHSLNGRPINNHPLNHSPLNGHHLNEHAFNGPHLNGPHLNGHAFNGPHLNEYPINGHPINGHPINGHPINGHPINGHPINGHAINGYSTNGHSIPLHLQRPNFKINSAYETTSAHESYKSSKLNDKSDKRIDKPIDKPIDKESSDNYSKLPPNELVNQLVDFDMSYLLPKHDHPALHSLMEDRYRRLIYGQFYESNQLSPSYLYESMPDHLNDQIPNKHVKKSILNKSNKKARKKDSKHLELKNGGQMHLIKMGIIK